MPNPTQDFESIRPYRDDEVPDVIRRLSHDPDLLRVAAAFFAPRLARALPWLARHLTQRFIKSRTANLQSVHDVQLWLSRYMARVVRDTIHTLSAEGLEDLPKDRPCLFISNHRDIVMDSGLLNYLIYHAGYRTARSAVGDNLLSEPYAADLMRLNKSFVVERNVSGAKAQFRTMTRTSAYIRHSLEEGESIWIAQREGRAKDGIDRTDPALLKMLALAYRDELSGIGDLLDRVALVPVSVTYELDPCAPRKAHECCEIAQHGRYRKAPGEDLDSMVAGIIGYKGRVHYRFGPVMTGDFADADSLAAALDRAIVGGLKVFPTHLVAAAELAAAELTAAEPVSTVPGPTCAVAGPTGIAPETEAVPAPIPRVMTLFHARLAECPPEERPYLLAGYANLIRNREALGFGCADPGAERRSDAGHVLAH